MRVDANAFLLGLSLLCSKCKHYAILHCSRNVPIILKNLSITLKIMLKKSKLLVMSGFFINDNIHSGLYYRKAATCGAARLRQLD